MIKMMKMISYRLQLLSASVTEEVCETETYIATCEASSVIAVTEALYGRMNLGRCLNIDLGYIGCYANVLSWASSKCNNQNSCELSPSDSELDEFAGCPPELRSYLEISYMCVAGNSTKMHSKYAYFLISLHANIVITSHEMYIENSLAQFF